MPETKICYTTEQIRYVTEVLARNNATIIFLQKALAHNHIDSPPFASADEIATSIRTLETGWQDAQSN